MAQVFQPRLVLWLKLSALAVVAFFVTVILIWRISIAPHPSIGSPVEQIVPFSHKHHVSDVGLDCRYCHTTVEKSAFAGMPPTDTCMTLPFAVLSQAARCLPPFPAKVSRVGQPLRWNRSARLTRFRLFQPQHSRCKRESAVTCLAQSIVCR